MPITAVGQDSRVSSSQLLVDLDARDSSAGTETWQNRGSLGSFKRIGNPKLIEIDGIPAVSFDGNQDAYQGPQTTGALEGRAPRTIEVWAYNPTVDSDEETLVAWGRRGGPDGSLMAFGWGRNPSYGAMAHWAADLGWNGVPKPKRWHYLVYTYDGATARVYDNGMEKSSRPISVRTGSGTTINLAAQNSGAGELQFHNEYTGGQQAGSLAIAEVRIRSGALTSHQISESFDREAKRYGATRPDAEGILAQGRETYTVGGFTLTLLRATQTAAALSPKGIDFDFLPGDRLLARASEGYYHLGDITLRLRTAGSPWQSYSSAANRDACPPLKSDAFAACDLTAALGLPASGTPGIPGPPVTVHREWVDANGHLALRFRITNHGAQPVEIGALGAPMVFNNLITGHSLDETHDRCSFADPYIGGPAGYLQVTRLNGLGPALLVLPETGTSFEAYRPLYDDPTPRDVTFEGFYEWMAHTRAYADNEWKLAQPWNTPTSRVLNPGETATYGFRFALAPEIKKIEATLIAEKRPVVIGAPGYVLPTDQTGRLFVRSASPVVGIGTEPDAALRIKNDPGPTPHGWRGITLTGTKPGRYRLTILYANGLKQFIHYFVIPPEADQVRRLGAFHAAKQWFTDPQDPFGRTYSFLPYNRETGAMVVQHPHTWFSGLSDEIGAGASVAMAMKNLGQPNAHEIALLEKYVNTVLWGKLQNPQYGVRASLFYYEPKALPDYRYTVRGGWDKARTETLWRSFNYPHVAAVYWALYRLARDHEGLVTMQPWSWYLEHAYGTIMGMKRFAPGYAEVGLMVGSVFPEIVRDLRREGWNDKADEVEGYMHERERRWVGLRYPFGSEMPWDSTGQEEIYTWCRYFGADDKAQVTLNAILGYMPTVPNWAYNGAGRRYFDAPVNGTRWPQIVRMTNHYGSAINSIPVIDAYRRHPDDLYLLRVGYAGMSQILTNIDAEGFGSYGFDADPAILKFDPYTADYGIAFYGYARNAGAYAIKDPEFGWLGFGCELQQAEARIRILPRDAFRQRVFIGPAHLWLTLDAGAFVDVIYEPKSGLVRATLAPADHATRTALLRVTDTSTSGPTGPQYTAPARLAKVRDAYAIPLAAKPVTLDLKPR